MHERTGTVAWRWVCRPAAPARAARMREGRRRKGGGGLSGPDVVFPKEALRRMPPPPLLGLSRSVPLPDLPPEEAVQVSFRPSLDSLTSVLLRLFLAKSGLKKWPPWVIISIT